MILNEVGLGGFKNQLSERTFGKRYKKTLQCLSPHPSLEEPASGNGKSRDHQAGVPSPLEAFGRHRTAPADGQPQGAANSPGARQPVYDHEVSFHPYRRGRLDYSADREVLGRGRVSNC